MKINGNYSIIELMYGEKGEIEFKVVGKKVVPQSMLEN